MFSSPAKSAAPSDILSPSAKIVDGVLILTLPDAIRPVVWQMELGQTKSSGMEVRELNDGTFVLTLKTPRQDVQDIAPYATREQAIKALLAVSRALETSTRLRPASEGATSNTAYHVPALIPSSFASSLTPAANGNGLKTMRVIAGILIVLGLLYVFTRPLPEASLTPAAGTSAAASPAGEPLSADDYLNAQ